MINLETIIGRQQKWRELFFAQPKGNYKPFSPTMEEKEFLRRLENGNKPAYNNKTKKYSWDSV